MSQFQKTISVLIGLSLALVPVFVSAAECSQDRAIYEDASQKYRLSFQTTSEASAVSHLFTIELSKADTKMDGNVQTTEDVPRSLGTLLYKCPDGDVTGADLEACIVWQGLIYTIDPKGKVGNLPAGTAPAANQILLSDFGAALRQSKIWTEKKLLEAPYDVFSYKECRS